MSRSFHEIASARVQYRELETELQKASTTIVLLAHNFDQDTDSINGTDRRFRTDLGQLLGSCSLSFGNLQNVLSRDQAIRSLGLRQRFYKLQLLRDETNLKRN